MTRHQVAKRLGKSLATVRRLEGVFLHPVQDSRGVHRFDGDEVEELARSMEDGRVVLWHEFGKDESEALRASASAACSNCSGLEEELEAVRKTLATERDTHQRELAALRRAHDAEARELFREIKSFVRSF